MQDLEAMGYPLPEDIEKLKWYGALDECLDLIDRRMAGDIPEALRQKLAIEKIQIQRMRRDYTVTPEQAEAVLRERLRDWKSGELDELRRGNFIDWCFVEGQLRYIDSFYENLIKIRADLRDRQLVPRRDCKRTETEIRDEAIALMKKSGGAVCTLTIRSRIDLMPPEHGLAGRLRVWLPYPIEDGCQTRTLTLLHAVPDPSVIAPTGARQRTLCFDADAANFRGAEITYRFENHTDYVDPDPERVIPGLPEGEYLSEQPPHIVFTPYLRALAAELVGQEQNSLKKARRIYDFLTQKVNYSYMRDYFSLPPIPEYCAARLRGDCGVQALTFITLCRIAGVPARWQSGLYANENEASSHDWAMFYAAPYGWLYADCSYGGAAWRDGAMERWNFYFGNLDPYRVVLASDWQADFIPPTNDLRRDPYDNQRGEVELDGHSLPGDQWRGGSETLDVRLAGKA